MRQRKLFSILAFGAMLCCVSITCMAQSQSGLLLGAGIGFESLSPNTSNSEYKKGTQFDCSYNYNVQLGYRFRFQNPTHERLFFDIDPLMKLQVMKDRTFYPGSSSDYTSVTAEATDINFQIALSPSINYRLFNRFYAGIGVEPTWNIVTDGKHFDIPAFARVGYSFGKVELALTYRQGFLNVIDDAQYDKGRISDLNIGLFIPFK